MIMNFIGTWHIYRMEMWDEDYFNMEVQAYITVNENGFGRFQFGLVSCSLNGKNVDREGQCRFEFSFEGNDECDPASGFGWFIQENKNKIKGQFRFHQDDSSTFLARKVK